MIMEALASAITLAQLATVLLEFCSRYRDAPKALDLAATKVELMSKNLSVLLRIKANLAETEINRDEIHETLDDCITGVIHAISIIKPMLPRQLESHSLKQRLKWAASDKGRFDELMETLSSVQASLNTTLQLIHWYETRQSVQTLKEIGSNINAELMELRTDVRHLRSLHVTDEIGAKPGLCNSDQSYLENDSTKPKDSVEIIKAASCKAEGALFSRSMAYTATSRRSSYVTSMQVYLPFRVVVKLDLAMQVHSFSRITFTGSSISRRFYVSSDSPIMLAAEKGNITAIRDLFSKHEASPFDYTDGGLTPLSKAIEGGHYGIVKLLLVEGADPNDIFGSNQTSPLSWALRHRQHNISRLLVSFNASFHHVNIWGWSPLFYLWPRPQLYPPALDFLELLRSNEVSFPWMHEGLIDCNEWGVMHRAAMFGTPEDLRLLIQCGVDPFQQTGKNQWTLLHAVVYWGAYESFLTLFPHYERRYGHDQAVRMTDSKGRTLLHIAAKQGHDLIIRKLFQLGADPYARAIRQDKRGQQLDQTPADLALKVSKAQHLAFLDALEEEVEQDQNYVWVDAAENL